MKLEDVYSIYLKCNAVCTDTRKLQPQDLYFALKGDNFNGNTFAERALEIGASYCVVDDKTVAQKHQNIILVDNVLETLQNLARYHRQQLNYPIIALTGSNGKTTTKELITRVLSSTYKVKSTTGNLNNHIGVPLTLLSFTSDLDFGVVEMGANHQKEIAFLSSIAQPDYGVITNFGKAHLEGFGGVEGVIKGKSELYDFLKAQNKTIIVNAEDKKQSQQIGNYDKVFTFGSGSSNDCNLKFLAANPFVSVLYNTATINSQLIGDYNFGNIAIAIAFGHYFKVSTSKITQTIESYVSDNNRSQIIHQDSNQIVLDAYNANPSSMLAALKNFTEIKASKKVLILGDMFELGEAAHKEHQYIIDYAEEHFTANIYAIGEHFSSCTTNSKTKTFKSFEIFIEEFRRLTIQDATIFVKGSRGMALERILEVL